MRARISLFLLFLLGFRAIGAVQTFPLDSIAVEGNRILSGAAVLTAAGLKKGDRVTAGEFDAARVRLIASGYFDTVAYRYKPSGTGGFDVTFEVREVTAMYPIRVEALPLSTADAIAYLKTKDPLFTGRMPGARQVLDRASKTLADFLASKGQAADVGARVVAIAPERYEVQFTPARGLPVVADVKFEGGRVIPAVDLHNKMNEVAIGQPFSDASFRVLLDNQIRPLYAAKGYMHVEFPNVTTQSSKDVTGLDVTVSVRENEQYKLSRVIVTGINDEESARMLRSAKIPKMTIANFDQIREGAARVKEAMRHQGYLDADVTTGNERDDAAKSVEFSIVVDPGPLYTFGALTINGLGLDGEAGVRRLWSVRAGDPFPVEYPDVFVSGVKEGGYFDNLGGLKATPKIDRDRHAVDVTLEFSGAAPAAKPKKPNGQIYPGATQPFPP